MFIHIEIDIFQQMKRWVCRNCESAWKDNTPEKCPYCSSFMVMPSASNSTHIQRCINETRCLVRMTDAMLQRINRPQSPTFVRAARDVLSITNSFKRLGVTMEDEPELLDPVYRLMAEEEHYQASQPLTPTGFDHRRVNVNEQKDGLVCPICYESFKAGEPVCELPCKHVFHDSCVRSWFQHEASTCPMCRSSLKDQLVENLPVRNFEFLFQ
ncbi:hypothetical protein TRFO_42077 [Tritrichomonas foetus]|uniref:RING-type E3 ubiquitin transferase n=1 Tax=Tritrichomonas foetus TaxID=1144522 RepID=A0A1J4KY22_9EUKA|nr:hypothetical protein TRFO_42077 [Tritrichomonas foetus]|eukprot:OHT16074.1 hypothetical protein TRFO_42077 [Tritrichomonas foetus]